MASPPSNMPQAPPAHDPPSTSAATTASGTTLKSEPLFSKCDPSLAPGCQYCCFSSDGRYLAATSDALQALFVWDLHSEFKAVPWASEDPGRRLRGDAPPTALRAAMMAAEAAAQPQPLFVCSHTQPLLALHWAPWNPHLLVWAQDKEAVCLVDVRWGGCVCCHPC